MNIEEIATSRHVLFGKFIKRCEKYIGKLANVIADTQDGKEFAQMSADFHAELSKLESQPRAANNLDDIIGICSVFTKLDELRASIMEIIKKDKYLDEISLMISKSYNTEVHHIRDKLEQFNNHIDEQIARDSEIFAAKILEHIRLSRDYTLILQLFKLQSSMRRIIWQILQDIAKEMDSVQFDKELVPIINEIKHYILLKDEPQTATVNIDALLSFRLVDKIPDGAQIVDMSIPNCDSCVQYSVDGLLNNEYIVQNDLSIPDSSAMSAKMIKKFSTTKMLSDCKTTHGTAADITTTKPIAEQLSDNLYRLYSMRTDKVDIKLQNLAEVDEYNRVQEQTLAANAHYNTEFLVMYKDKLRKNANPRAKIEQLKRAISAAFGKYTKKEELIDQLNSDRLLKVLMQTFQLGGSPDATNVAADIEIYYQFLYKIDTFYTRIVKMLIKEISKDKGSSIYNLDYIVGRILNKGDIRNLVADMDFEYKKFLLYQY